MLNERLMICWRQERERVAESLMLVSFLRAHGHQGIIGRFRISGLGRQGAIRATMDRRAWNVAHTVIAVAVTAATAAAAIKRGIRPAALNVGEERGVGVRQSFWQNCVTAC